MNPSIIRISLDLTRRDVQCTTAVGQGETGRRIEIRLLENGKPYEITGDCFAVLAGTKPDGNTIYNGCVIQDNTVIYDMTKQMAAVCGAVKCQVKLASVDGGEIASPKFLIAVHEKAYDQTVVESASELGALAELCGLADKAREGAVTAKEGAEEAARRAEAAEERTKEIVQTKVDERVGEHNATEGTTVHPYIQDRIDTNAMSIVNLNAQLKGIARSFTVDTFQALMSFLNHEYAIRLIEDRDGDGEDEEYEIYPENLRTGDNIFIIEQNVPDFWFSGDASHEDTYTYQQTPYSLAAYSAEGSVIGYVHKLEVDYNVIQESAVSAGLSAERANAAALSAERDAIKAENAAATAEEVTEGTRGKVTALEAAADILYGNTTSLKNIVKWERGWYNDGGVKENASTEMRTVDMYRISPTVEIRHTGKKTDGENRTITHRAHFYDKDKAYIKRDFKTPYAVPENAAYVAFTTSYASVNASNPSLDAEGQIDILLSYWDVTIKTDTQQKLDELREDMATPGDLTFASRRQDWRDADFDTLLKSGVYYLNSTNAKLPLNIPETKGGTLVVFRPDNSHAQAGTVQVYITQGNKIYIRCATTSKWTAWKEAQTAAVDTEIKYKKYEQETSRLLSIYETAFREWTPVSDEMLDIDSWDDNGNYGTLTSDTGLEGILYSSVYRTGGDVFINRNLSTFYSAALNPYSVLYKRPVNTNHDNGSNRCTWYGTVCSTFVTAMLGHDIHYLTNEIQERYVEIGYERVEIKSFDDFEQIRPGMVLYRPGHVQLVYDVGVNDKGRKCVGVIESGVPRTRFIVYRWEAIYKNFIGEGATHMFLRSELNENKIKERFTIHEYATDLIADYGNNTWYPLGTPVKLYNATGASVVYYKKETESGWHEIAVTEKNIDVTGIVTDAGIWHFTTDTSNMVYCNVEVVDFGSVTVNHGAKTVTMRGYNDTIEPHYVEIMRSRNTESGNAVSTYVRAMVSEDAAHYETDLDSYWVRCYFNTEYGMAIHDVPYNDPPIMNGGETID